MFSLDVSCVADHVSMHVDCYDYVAKPEWQNHQTLPRWNGLFTEQHNTLNELSSIFCMKIKRQLRRSAALTSQVKSPNQYLPHRNNNLASQAAF